jgi:hypothetical protein
MKIILITLTTLIMISTHANEYLPWQDLKTSLRKAGGNTKMIDHVQCFMERNRDHSFELKRPTNDAFLNRCYQNGYARLGLDRTFTVIDYTVPSNRRRMFLVDRQTGQVSTMAVAHGRYTSWFMRWKTKKNHNSTKMAKYFSNDFGSNASASGFYLAGGEYYGKWDRSLILHGLEKNINDNACQRATVIHAHKMVSKSKAYIMSSGCPMVAPTYLDHVINIMKAPEGKFTGGLVFVYGPREKKWSPEYCGEI